MSNPSIASLGKTETRLQKLAASCEEVTLSKCPLLKKTVDLGPSQVPYVISLLSSSETGVRKAAAHVLQFFPQEEGVKALALQWNRERNREVRTALDRALRIRGKGPLLRLVRDFYASETPGERVIASNLVGAFDLLAAEADLVASTNDAAPRVQYAAVSAMGKLKESERVRMRLLQLVGQPGASWTIRHKATQSLTDLGVAQAAPLIAALSAHPEAELRRGVISALGKLRVAWATPIFVEALQDPKTVGVAAIALTNLKDHSSSRPLMKALSQPSLEKREKTQLLWALGSLEVKESVPLLLDMLDEKDSEITYHTVTALGQIGDPRAISPLIFAMNHPDQRVRDIALWGLERITGQKLGFDNEEWMKWYKSTQEPSPTP